MPTECFETSFRTCLHINIFVTPFLALQIFVTTVSVMWRKLWNERWKMWRTDTWYIDDDACDLSLSLSLSFCCTGRSPSGLSVCRGLKGSVEPMQHKAKVKVYASMTPVMSECPCQCKCDVIWDAMRWCDVWAHRQTSEVSQSNLLWWPPFHNLVYSYVYNVRFAAFHNSRISWHSEGAVHS